MAGRRRRRSGRYLAKDAGASVVALAVLAYFYPGAFGAIFGLVLAVLILCGVAFVGWRVLLYLRRRDPSELSRRFSEVRGMSGQEFERFTADLFLALGYRAEVIGGSGDQGVDVIAVKDWRRVAIQCKNHAKAVGNKPVQEVYAGAAHHRCTESVVIAPAGFTKGAVELSRSTGVTLIDAKGIEDHIRKARAVEKSEPPAEPRVVPEQTGVGQNAFGFDTRRR